jgi:hypothetical protein
MKKILFDTYRYVMWMAVIFFQLGMILCTIASLGLAFNSHWAYIFGILLLPVLLAVDKHLINKFIEWENKNQQKLKDE